MLFASTSEVGAVAEALQAVVSIGTIAWVSGLSFIDAGGIAVFEMFPWDGFRRQAL